MPKKNIEETRMRKEILETALGLQAHGVMSKVEVAKAVALFAATTPKALKRVAGPNKLN